MPATRRRRTYLPAPALALISALLAAAIASWLPPETLTHLMREGGPVETATALVYAAAAGALWVMPNPVFGLAGRTAGTIVLGSCIAREVSVRKWLLSTDPGAYCCTQAETQIVIGVMLVMLVAAGAWLIARHTRALLTGLWQRKPVPVTIGTMFACAALSQVLDRAPKITLALFGHVLSGRGRAVALSLEEVLEMLLPALVILAIVQANRRANRD